MIRTYVRLLVAALVAAVPAELLALAIHHAAGTGTGGSLATIIVAAPVALGGLPHARPTDASRELNQLASMLPFGRH